MKYVFTAIITRTNEERSEYVTATVTATLAEDLEKEIKDFCHKTARRGYGYRLVSFSATPLFPKIPVILRLTIEGEVLYGKTYRKTVELREIPQRTIKVFDCKFEVTDVIEDMQNAAIENINAPSNDVYAKILSGNSESAVVELEQRLVGDGWIKIPDHKV